MSGAILTCMQTRINLENSTSIIFKLFPFCWFLINKERKTWVIEMRINYIWMTGKIRVLHLPIITWHIRIKEKIKLFSARDKVPIVLGFMACFILFDWQILNFLFFYFVLSMESLSNEYIIPLYKAPKGRSFFVWITCYILDNWINPCFKQFVIWNFKQWLKGFYILYSCIQITNFMKDHITLCLSNPTTNSFILIPKF